MLSSSDNELLTRVGPGTPMGQLFREYWLPVLLSSELPDRDGPPLRVRMLGEDLLAFRDTQGSVGLLGENCPHRGASLFFGRNEEAGLRCVYHGWKYDVTGRCVDMPNEPPESNFRDKVRHTAYPCREAAGVVWTYMGSRTPPPPLPDVEPVLVPESHHVAAKITEDCNWLQILEGDLDSVHTEFLHSRLDTASEGPGLPRSSDRHPRIEVAWTEYGLVKGARRRLDDGRDYWRIYQFLLPAMVMLPATGDTIPYRMTVPIDDGHTSFWNGEFSPERPLTEDERARHQVSRATGGYVPATSDPLSRWRPVASRANNYLRDPEAQRTQLFSGIPPVKLQDIAMTESMGVVMDRANEHLGTSDAAIIQMRRRILETARALREGGVTPPGVDDPSVFRVRSATAILARDTPWLDEVRELLQARPGHAILSVPRPR